MLRYGMVQKVKNGLLLKSSDVIHRMRDPVVVPMSSNGHTLSL